MELPLKIDPTGALPAIQKVEDKLSAAERKAKELSREMTNAFRQAGPAFHQLGDAIEMEARMMERATGQARNFGFQLAALTKLHNEGRISAEQYIKTLDRMGVKIEKVTGNVIAMQRAQTQQAVETIGFGSAQPSSIAQGGGMLNKVGGAAGAALGGVALASAAVHANDEWVELTNSVRKFEQPGKSASAVLAEIGDMAHHLHQPLEKTIVLFDGVEGATKDLGLSQKEMMDISKNLGMLMLNDGKSLEAAGAMMERLEFAMSTGTITGRELKTMMRDFPDIAELWTKATGKSAAELSKMGLEGTEAISKLITSLADGGEAAKKFEERGVTLGQRWDEFKHSVGQPLNFAPFLDSIDEMKRGARVIDEFTRSARKLAEEWDKLASAPLVGKQLKDANDMFDQVEQQFGSFNRGQLTVMDPLPPTEEMKRKTEELKKQREEYEKIAKALLGTESPSARAIREGAQDRAEFRAGVERDTQEEIDIETRAESRREAWAKMELDIEQDAREAQRRKQEAAAESAKKMAEDQKRAAEEVKEAWAEGTGEAIGSLIKMAGEGEKSISEMANATARKLAVLAVQMAATQMGGPWGGFFGSLAGAIGGGANGFDHIVGPGRGIELPGFAKGGDFTVGGSGGIDSKLAMFRVTPGESVHVRTPAQQVAGGGDGGMLARIAAALERGMSPTFQVQDNQAALVDGVATSYAGEVMFAKMQRKVARR